MIMCMNIYKLRSMRSNKEKCSYSLSTTPSYRVNQKQKPLTYVAE
jgi:hypothetical protein